MGSVRGGKKKKKEPDAIFWRQPGGEELIGHDSSSKKKGGNILGHVREEGLGSGGAHQGGGDLSKGIPPVSRRRKGKSCKGLGALIEERLFCFRGGRKRGGGPPKIVCRPTLEREKEENSPSACSKTPGGRGAPLICADKRRSDSWDEGGKPAVQFKKERVEHQAPVAEAQIFFPLKRKKGASAGLQRAMGEKVSDKPWQGGVMNRAGKGGLCHDI